ncbi:hypothetical protein EVAR_69291_1 [Eumeta japonica]|uniref:Uncharacterized protein n=1 Tax=Eumeta variegata TaxID=151549 RepID=A0A4C2AAV9_EUMVA|nr:hypothetical protein EVAR_69291_1 [Eumeta japonica]
MRSGSLPTLPVLETIRPYHTTAGDAVWYLGPELDPKPEDLIPPNEPCAASLVERWRHIPIKERKAGVKNTEELLLTCGNSSRHHSTVTKYLNEAHAICMEKTWKLDRMLVKVLKKTEVYEGRLISPRPKALNERKVRVFYFSI